MVYLSIFLVLLVSYLPSFLSFQKQPYLSRQCFKRIENRFASTSSSTLSPASKKQPKVVFNESKLLANKHITILLSQETSGFALHPTLPVKLTVEYDHSSSIGRDVALSNTDLMGTIGNAISVRSFS